MNLKGEWEEYKRLRYGSSEIPEEQEFECKSAFVAGCALIMGSVLSACTDDEPGSVESLREIHQAIFREQSDMLKRGEQLANPEGP